MQTPRGAIEEEAAAPRNVPTLVPLTKLEPPAALFNYLDALRRKREGIEVALGGGPGSDVRFFPEKQTPRPRASIVRMG